MSRRTSLITVLAALAAGTATPAAAEPIDPRPPTIGVDVIRDRIEVRGQQRAEPGYVRLRFRARATGEPYSLAVIELKPGHRPREVSRLQLAGLQDAERVEPIGRLVAGATLWPGQQYLTRIVMRDRRFAVVDVGHEDQRYVGFRPGGGGAATPPGRHDARVTIRDDRVVAPDMLPRKGLIRIANRGDRAHSLVALRLWRGLSAQEARRQVRDGVEPARIGRRFDLLGVVSGDTVNWVEARLPRGRYLLVSYYGGLHGPGSDAARGLIVGVAVG